MLAEVLKKRGLGAKALRPDAISAGHIASLAKTEAKLVCLSYLGLGAGPALIRYVVRRLRRILPQGTAIIVCYWPRGRQGRDQGHARDRRSRRLRHHAAEAVELCVKSAKGELEERAERRRRAERARPTQKPPARRSG